MTEEGVMAVNIGCSPVDTPPSRGCGWSLAEEGASGLFSAQANSNPKGGEVMFGRFNGGRLPELTGEEEPGIISSSSDVMSAISSASGSSSSSEVELLVLLLLELTRDPLDGEVAAVAAAR